MHLRVDINGQGYPILFLHGHPGSRECHQVFTQVLSSEWLTIAPDLRGYGQSKSSTSFEIYDHINDLIDLLDRLEIKECIVLGWSLGGLIGMELVLQHPERIKGLILVASAAYPVSQHPKITWQDNALTVIASVINKVSPGWTWNIKTFGQRSLYRHLIQTHHPHTYKYLAQYAWPAFFNTSKYAQQALTQALSQGYNRTDSLPEIQVPTLVLAGEFDRHITAQASQQTAEGISNCQFICYPKTAHLFPWEIPDQVNRDIVHWLAQNKTDFSPSGS